MLRPFSDGGGAAQTQRPKELEDVVGRQRLADKVSGILHRIERDLDTVDSRIGEAMHVLDVDNDGLVSLRSTVASLTRPVAGKSALCSVLHSLLTWRTVKAWQRGCMLLRLWANANTVTASMPSWQQMGFLKASASPRACRPDPI